MTERERRHARAVAQSLRWADEAARMGEYDKALNWLDTVEAVSGGLDADWVTKRGVWTAAGSAHPQSNARDRS